jgi:uncharacterized integral membrane protein
MKRLLRLLQWLLKAAIFFTLFAFALNNQQETRVNFFFGTFWQAPTVLVVLSAFSLGVVVGAWCHGGGAIAKRLAKFSLPQRQLPPPTPTTNLL